LFWGLRINDLLVDLDTGLFVDLDAAGLAIDGFLVAVDLADFATLELEETAEAGFFSAFFSPFFSAGLPILLKKKRKEKQ